MTNIVSMWFKNLTANYGYMLKATTSLGTKLDVTSHQSLYVSFEDRTIYFLSLK